MEQTVAQLRTVVIPGCGHWIQQERPDEVTGELLTFLQQHIHSPHNPGAHSSATGRRTTAMAASPSPPPLINGSSGRRIKDSDRRFIRVLTGTHRRILAAGRGRILGRMGGHPLLILTTTGRRTGRPYSTPVIGIPSGADWLVVASNGGAATQPLWLRNIAASAQVTIRHGNQTEPFHARILRASERSQRWPKLVDRKSVV